VPAIHLGSVTAAREISELWAEERASEEIRPNDAKQIIPSSRREPILVASLMKELELRVYAREAEIGRLSSKIQAFQ